METIDDRYFYLVETALMQCRELLEIFERIEMPEDESLEPETLRGITRTPVPFDRAALVFYSDDTPKQRTLVVVDAILDLAQLIIKEPVIETREPAP